MVSCHLIGFLKDDLFAEFRHHVAPGQVTMIISHWPDCCPMNKIHVIIIQQIFEYKIIIIWQFVQTFIIRCNKLGNRGNYSYSKDLWSQSNTGHLIWIHHVGILTIGITQAVLPDIHLSSSSRKSSNRKLTCRCSNVGWMKIGKNKCNTSSFANTSWYTQHMWIKGVPPLLFHILRGSSFT